MKESAIIEIENSQSIKKNKSSDLVHLHQSIVHKIQKDMMGSCFDLKCPSFEDAHEKIPIWISYITSLPAILYYGLSLNDFKDGWYRWVFASASFITNYFQMMVVDQITLKRYANYLKTVLTIPFSDLLNITHITETRHKIFIGTKNVVQFSVYEIAKWCMLYYISIVPASLARQVDWLNFPDIEKMFHIATMLMLEPSLHDRLQELRLPSFTHTALVKDEIHKLRQLFNDILIENEWDARADLHSISSQLLLNAINTNDYNPECLLSDALSVSRHKSKKILLDPKIFYLHGIIAFIFIAFESMANAGNYRATWENPDMPLIYHIGSILGDFGFGVFIALRAAESLTQTVTHILSDSQNYFELRKMLLALVSLGISSLTIGSALSVSTKEHMGYWVGFLGVLLGTILDNGIFLNETLQSWENKITLRLKKTSVRHQRAELDYFYKHLRKNYQNLSDSQFVQLLKEAVETDPFLFEGYELCFQKSFPWSYKKNTPAEIIQTLALNPDRAMDVINTSGRFGIKRKKIEWLACFTAAFLTGGVWIQTNDPYLHMLFHVVFPLMGIPAALTVETLMSPPLSQGTPLLEEDSMDESQNELDALQNETSKSAFLTAFTLAVLGQGVKYGSQFVIRWIASNIFDQSDPDSEVYSECASNLIGTAVTFAFTHSLVTSLR